MGVIRSYRSRARLEAIETWRAAAVVVSARWDAFVAAEAGMRQSAFASYLAALDCEEAAAADLAEVARPAAA